MCLGGLIIQFLEKQQTWIEHSSGLCFVVLGELQWLQFCLYTKSSPKSLSAFPSHEFFSLSLFKELLKYLLLLRKLLVFGVCLEEDASHMY